MSRVRGWRTALVVAAACGLGGPAASATQAATIPLSGHVVYVTNDYTVAGAAKCAAKDILLIDVPADVVSYTASVKQTGPYFGSTLTQDFSFSGPPYTNPITGYGNPYYVPSGEAGWFIGGGSGSAPCTQANTYSDLQAAGVVATVAITHSTIRPRSGTATFRFSAPIKHSRFECALIRRPTTSHRLPKPRYRVCRSPQTYAHLLASRYGFDVRAYAPGATGSATTEDFTIR